MILHPTQYAAFSATLKLTECIAEASSCRCDNCNAHTVRSSNRSISPSSGWRSKRCRWGMWLPRAPIIFSSSFLGCSRKCSFLRSLCSTSQLRPRKRAGNALFDLVFCTLAPIVDVTSSSILCRSDRGRGLGFSGHARNEENNDINKASSGWAFFRPKKQMVVERHLWWRQQTWQTFPTSKLRSLKLWGQRQGPSDVR